MSWLILALGATALAQPTPEQVTLSLDEFLTLYEGTKNRPDKPEVAPRAWALSAARYTGQVILDDDEPISALFTVRMRIENLKEQGWVRVPVLPANVAVRSARLGGVEAPLVLEGGSYVLITDRVGAMDLTVTFAVGVTTQQGSSGFTFPLSGSGATEVELSVPASEALDFTVANAELQQDRRSGTSRVVTAVLPSQGSLSVSWQRTIDEASEEGGDDDAVARLYAEVHTLVGVGDGLLSARVTLQETILFAGVDQIQAQIPADMTVLDVRGTGLRDWNVDDDGVLTALLNYKAEGSYSLSMDLERVLGDDSAGAAVPLVVPIGVERAKGWVGVQALGNLELSSGAVTGAATVDVRTLPASIVAVTDQPVLLGYKYLTADASIPLNVQEHAEVDVLVTLLDQAEATTMFTRDGRRLTQVRYQVRNNRRQFLRLRLPGKAELWSASVAGKSVQPAMSGDDELLVPLVRSQASGGSLAAFTVDVVYIESGDGPDATGHGTFEAQLPTADAPTTYVGWTVYAPWDAKIPKRSFAGSLRDVAMLSRPLGAAQVLNVPGDQAAMQQGAGSTFSNGGLGQGAAPVEVSLPVDGQPLAFEKLLALDERLWVRFAYRKLK